MSAVAKISYLVHYKITGLDYKMRIILLQNLTVINKMRQKFITKCIDFVCFKMTVIIQNVTALFSINIHYVVVLMIVKLIIQFIQWIFHKKQEWPGLRITKLKQYGCRESCREHLLHWFFIDS